MRSLPAVSLSLLLALVIVSPIGGADHEETGVYEIPVWFDWNTKSLDVLVVPPEHGQLVNSNGLLDGANVPDEANPCTTSFLAAILDSIQGWRNGIAAFGSANLKQVDIRVHVLGCSPGVPPTNLEIVVYTDETKGPVLGFGLSTRPCVVNNSKFGLTASFTYEDMYNVMGQEFGHCLGLLHTGDANGGTVGDPGHPEHDVMEGRYEHTIGSAGVHKHCISNLDVKGLEEVFDGQGGDAGRVVTVPVSQYALAPCA